MKKYIVKLTLGLMLSAAFITACTDDDDDDQAIAFGLSTEELVFPENGGTESVTITAANTWNINANASCSLFTGQRQRINKIHQHD